MAAGDITKALVTRVRSLINETNAGFWTGTTSANGDIQTYLDNAQSFIIDWRLLRLMELQRMNKTMDDPVLDPLITSTQVAWATSQNYITLPALRFLISAEMVLSSSGATLPITKLNVDEFRLRRTNYYIGHNTNETDGTGQVFYFVTSSMLVTSYPAGTHSTYYDKINIYYITTPSTMSNSVDPVLSAYCYEGLVQYACYLALMKKKEYDKAQIHLTNFIKWIG